MVWPSTRRSETRGERFPYLLLIILRGLESQHMRNTLNVLLAALMAASMFGKANAEPASAHDFTFEKISGGALPLAQYRGKAVLVVNTASFCGFTKQYEGLQSLWAEYENKGLVVLGVPSNDFGAQEPGSESEIKKFCQGAFGVSFPLTKKAIVKGENAHPFYAWAKATLGSETAPKWNFHKYLVGPDGRLVGWFPTRTEPSSPDVRKAVEAVLPRQG